jgi:large subunit ribosomal protein L29
MPETASQLRELSDAELVEKHAEYKQELFNLRFQLVTGQLDDITQLKQAKRAIARVLTIQRERALHANTATEA